MSRRRYWWFPLQRDVAIWTLGLGVGVFFAMFCYVGASTAPRDAETGSDSTVAPAAVLESQQPSVSPTALLGEATAAVGADGAGESSAPAATPTPPSASEEPEVSERLDASQARSVESGWRSGPQWYGLALYVSDSFDWAEQYVFNVGCESTNGARRVTHEENGSTGYGPNSINDEWWAERFDLPRLIYDDLYAVQVAYELWLDDGTWDYWSEVCRP